MSELETSSKGTVQIADDQDTYRALNVWAVVSLMAGVFSVLAFAHWVLWPLPLGAVVAGWAALRRIRSAPTEWTGARLAWAGILLGAGLWSLAVAHGLISRWLTMMHARALADRFTQKVEAGDLEAAFWLTVPRSQRQKVMKEGVSKEEKETLFERYATFYNQMSPTIETPKYKLSFEKFGSVGHQFGNDYAELVYKVKVEDEVYHLVIRVAGVKRSTFGPKEWVVMDQSFQ